MASFGPDVQIRVLVKRPDFQDALYYSAAEFEAAKDSEIEAAAEARYQGFLRNLSDAKARPREKPKRSELDDEIANLEQRKLDIQAQISAGDFVNVAPKVEPSVEG